MKWSQSGMNWLKWPFFMGTQGKTILWMKCLLFRLRPPGRRTGRPFIEQVLGLKWWKNSLYPAKPALPKPHLRLRPAGIRTGRHPGLDQALARWFRTWDDLGMRIASRKCGLEWFPYIYILFTLWWSYFSDFASRETAKVLIFIYTCRQYQDEYVLHM